MHYVILLFIFYVHVNGRGYSVIKEIDGIVYAGGMNSLYSFSIYPKSLEINITMHYDWITGDILNTSAIGFDWTYRRWPENFPRGPKSLAYDNCLNWKDQHPDDAVRNTNFQYYRAVYHTQSGDFETMNYTCVNSFIKAIEPLGDDKLWVCGTFGAFPRAFSVNRTSLEFIEFVDRNIMTCARYVDEPMATYTNNLTKERYIASGWGLYRPDARNPDVVNNNSTMLYADWRLYRIYYTTPSSMSLVLSSDVNFIKVVKETETHLYFFGHEISNQYGLYNQDDRNAWQSFMLRICKNDTGFKYSPADDIGEMASEVGRYVNYAHFGEYDFKLNPGYNDYHYIKNLPYKHFLTSMKVNFGCYMSKRPRAISDNHFWGETNVVYMNRLADVIFDPKRRLRFKTESPKNISACREEPHSQIPLIGLFNRPGIVGTSVEPTGALCHLHINENIFIDEGSKRGIYNSNSTLYGKNAFEELMAISSTSTNNFYEEVLHRTNAYTLYPSWNQGVYNGRNNEFRNSLSNVFGDIGKCQNKSFYEKLTTKGFLNILNFTNTAWPNEIANRLTSLAQQLCMFYAAELYSFNATFVVPGVEFKRVFVIEENITDYVMHGLINETENDTLWRRKVSPLMIVGIISTSGVFYRVVVCDFDSAIDNDGFDKTKSAWYNWCIMRHTDQPYLYRQYHPMEMRARGVAVQFRASSLLINRTVVLPEDRNSYPINRDPQFHVVKDVLEKGDYIHVLTTNNIHSVALKVDCSNYSRCIDCASDPKCMWSTTVRKCENYSPYKYNDSKFVQDVLDRGFKCWSFLDKSKENVTHTNVFECKNAAYWRGNIVWKKVVKGNETDIRNGVDNIFLSDKYLYIQVNYSHGWDSVTCYGVKDDMDRLYDGAEYAWINERSYTTEVILNSFVFLPERSPGLNAWVFLVIICHIIMIIEAIVIIMMICKKKKKNQGPTSPSINSPTDSTMPMWEKL